MKMEVADETETGLDLCFALSKSEAAAGEVEVPKMVLHFDGGADWELPAENYFVTDLESGVLCLAMMKSSGMSILGNFQQQNMHVVYDLEKETLSFAPAKCSQI
ncbi:Protein ASPARTIC PROTEASE IN GUARD CELL 2 [Acorus calamus]|uniref:Protein ASPARTIC PROTEASE IN GUARD CELL 2 n=1 Tax=Acorus calamus TaxID=4465 RepID=A0AAV9E4M1_ACOCL|nr:Protein ASPARTIC PROTEASE IN GUARD CELL 2 [Acorus calamus]